jgi:hypothetical protein
MRRTAILIGIMAISVLHMGCGGDAEVTVVNNTSVYIEGDFDGKDSFGLPPNGMTTRSIEVGSFWRSSSTVDINCRFHEDEYYDSSIAWWRTFNEKFQSDESYTFDIYSNMFGDYFIRELGADRKSGILEP